MKAHKYWFRSQWLMESDSLDHIVALAADQVQHNGGHSLDIYSDSGKVGIVASLPTGIRFIASDSIPGVSYDPFTMKRSA